jgi:hypothetical protein
MQGPESGPPRAASGGATEAGGSGRAYQQPKPAVFEGVRSTGPGCEIFWPRAPGPLLADTSGFARGCKRANMRVCMCRRDEGWTRLLKEGPELLG